METIFDRAIRHIENGWCKGLVEDSNGNVCAIGAIQNSGRTSLESVLAEEFLEKVVLEQYPDRVIDGISNFGPVAQFNDDPLTTKEEVVRMMEKANAEWQEQL